MPRVGRPPVPTELKRRRGNPGGRRLPTPVVLIAPAEVRLPDRPNSGDEFIRSLMDGPAAAWIGEPDRLGLLDMVRQGWTERLRLRKAMDELGAGWELGRYQPAGLLRLAQVEKDLTTWLSLLGLTPADRSRLGVAEVRAQSKLDALRERRGNRLNRSRAG